MSPLLGVDKQLRQQVAQVIARLPAQSVVELLQYKPLHLYRPHVAQPILAERRKKVQVEG
jgi:hypothetical protein